jgi:putative membrane protein
MGVHEEKKHNLAIIIISIVIPLAVAALFSIRIEGIERLWFLPPIYSTMNGLTAILLVAALIAIKNGHQQIHQRLMKVCIIFSVTFLVLYIAYHTTSDSTPYGGEGFIQYVYYFILVSHIILSIGLIPMVLLTYDKTLYNNFKAHKKLARYTFPIWLYVAVTGVVIYIMISPYYPV